MIATRRRFLSLLGLGVAAAGVELVAPEPVRRYWQVPRNAPVAPREPLWLGTEVDPASDWLAPMPELREILGPRFCEHTGPCFCNLPRRLPKPMVNFDGAPLFGNEHLPEAYPGQRRDIEQFDEARAFAKMAECLESRDPHISALIEHRSRLRSIGTSPFGEPVDIPERVLLARDGAYVRGDAVDIGQTLAGQPIGTIESYDPETGIATVRLGGPLVAWKGTGVA